MVSRAMVVLRLNALLKGISGIRAEVLERFAYMVKNLIHPASVDSIPSSSNQEDHVSMGTIGARHAYAIIKNARHFLAIEALCAWAGCHIRGVEQMAPKTRVKFEELIDIIRPIDKDRIFTTDIEKLAQFLVE